MNGVIVEGFNFFSLYGAHMGVRSDNCGWRYKVAIPDHIAGPFKSLEELKLNAEILGYEIKGYLLSKHYDDVFDTYRDDDGKIHRLEELLGEKAHLI